MEKLKSKYAYPILFNRIDTLTTKIKLFTFSVIIMFYFVLPVHVKSCFLTVDSYGSPCMSTDAQFLLHGHWLEKSPVRAIHGAAFQADGSLLSCGN